MLLSDIVAKGGWCDLVLKHNKNHLIGRIADFNHEYVVLEYFDIQLDDFDGYVIIRKERILEVNEGNWVEHYITVGFHDYEEHPFPEILKRATYLKFLRMLINQVMSVKVVLVDGRFIAGHITSILDKQISVTHTSDSSGPVDIIDEKDVELIFIDPEIL